MIQFDDSFSDAKVKELHALEEERVVEDTAPILGYPYIDLHNTPINPESLLLLKESVARGALVCAFEINNRTISIAAKKPNSPEVAQLVQEFETKKYSVMLFMCSQGSLEHGWERYKDIVGATAEKRGTFSVDVSMMNTLMSQIKHKTDVATIVREIGSANNTRRITDTLALVFAGALSLRASDIHIEPEETGIRLRYRLDGVLHDIVDLDSYIYKRLMSRLKLLSGMVLNVRAEAQDGRFTFDTGEREVEVRSSIIPGAIGESIVMRLLDPTVSSFSLDSIDLNPYVEAALLKQLKRPNGLIITTGPTGSGKTTALYACLQEVHDESKKIITIENPVEYKLEGVMHTQTDKDYTFAQGLRAILRQDPDVIMVGEIRDKEVAETAVHAAQTGHLVFSTLHTNSAIGAFTRLVDIGIDRQSLGGSINLILGQRLVRKLCENCKTSYEASESEQRLVSYIMSEHPYPTTIPTPLMLNRSVGCEVCGNTGFKGRVGVFEGVLMDERVEEVLLRDPRETSLQEAAKSQKIPTMLQDGLDKALAGITSLPELERVLEFPPNLSLTENIDATVEEVAPESSELAEEVADEEFKSHIV